MHSSPKKFFVLGLWPSDGMMELYKQLNISSHEQFFADIQKTFLKIFTSLTEYIYHLH